MRALIRGVSGQDGAYLARLLLEKGYEVFGMSRDAHPSPFSNLDTDSPLQRRLQRELRQFRRRARGRVHAGLPPQPVRRRKGRELLVGRKLP